MISRGHGGHPLRRSGQAPRGAQNPRKPLGPERGPGGTPHSVPPRKKNGLSNQCRDCRRCGSGRESHSAGGRGERPEVCRKVCLVARFWCRRWTGAQNPRSSLEIVPSRLGLGGRVSRETAQGGGYGGSTRTGGEVVGDMLVGSWTGASGEWDGCGLILPAGWHDWFCWGDELP
jgi:hypothetical protein